ncbi:rhophilin-2-B isoform X4 [Leguminivora glycinivorella]|uniref:rhophilin-2-B isoform X4 n=1 Tax=Leguminivora glycinivorella TaxID=1035111 RepID=UPI00200DC0CD|nr:rhophilin-2-B isoform X4 [Leguminivora glycinivorella]
MGDLTNLTMHRTCVRVSSADDESRDEVDHDLPKKNPFIRATTNRKLRETVALELSFVNSNLQLLKEQLAELNSSVELYQNDSKECVMPMIPLGLKETKEVDFREPFKDFILEHYSEDASAHEEAISDFMDMRQAIRTPVRSTAGVALLFKYYNQLYFIERRFFPPDRSLGVYFEWFDSLTGVPSCQRTVAFEKACVLFNIAGIYTQIGAKQERHTSLGLDGAVDALLRAAGTLRYIHENFTNAPSVDLAADTLLVLAATMTAQARECLFEKLQLQARECGRGELRDDLDMCLDFAQEAAQCAHTYTQLYQKMQTEGVFNYVPYSWVSLVHVKTEFYKALAHQYAALGLLHADSTPRARQRVAALYTSSDRSVDNGSVSNAKMDDDLDFMVVGRAHLVEAQALYEEAQRLQRMCRELRGKEPLARVIRAHAERAARERATLRDSPDLSEMELLDAPTILPSSKFQLSLTPPDFAQHRVDDLFKSLGPIAVFSAKRHWSAPRLITLQKHSNRDSCRRINTRNYDLDKRSEKRDRSEDNSAYYNSVIRDENYEDYEKQLQRVMKQNGVYINSYNNMEYHPKVLDYDKYDYRSNESFIKTTTESVNGKLKNGMERRKEPLRRVASEYNVSNSKDDDGFGFSVRGDAPVMIAAVEPNSLADIGGMREGDFIISVGDKDVKWSSHEEVVRLIQQAGDLLALRLATPMDKSLMKSSPDIPRQSNSNQGSVSAASTASSGSTAATARSSARRAPSWNPFRRHTTRDNSSHRGSHTSNVIFR